MTKLAKGPKSFKSMRKAVKPSSRIGSLEELHGAMRIQGATASRGEKNSPDKGAKGGSCNVTACQRPESAHYYNHSTKKFYCRPCAQEINRWNRTDTFTQSLGHDLCTLDPEFADRYKR